MSLRSDLPATLRAPRRFLSGLLLAANAMASPAVDLESDRFPPVNVEDSVVLYPITGRNAAELRAQLENHGPMAAEPGHGRTRSVFEIASTLEPVDVACHLVAATISLRTVITLPQWVDRRGASTGEVERWLESLALLERHEAGHRGHAVDAADVLRDALAKLPPQRDCRTLQWAVDRELQRVVWKLEMLGNRYDSRTGNGSRDDPLQ
jgi:predicted secreted Zn-dependent protease